MPFSELRKDADVTVQDEGLLSENVGMETAIIPAKMIARRLSVISDSEISVETQSETDLSANKIAEKTATFKFTNGNTSLKCDLCTAEGKIYSGATPFEENCSDIKPNFANELAAVNSSGFSLERKSDSENPISEGMISEDIQIRIDNLQSENILLNETPVQVKHSDSIPTEQKNLEDTCSSEVSLANKLSKENESKNTSKQISFSENVSSSEDTSKLENNLITSRYSKCDDDSGLGNAEISEENDAEDATQEAYERDLLYLSRNLESEDLSEEQETITEKSLLVQLFAKKFMQERNEKSDEGNLDTASKDEAVSSFASSNQNDVAFATVISANSTCEEEVAREAPRQAKSLGSLDQSHESTNLCTGDCPENRPKTPRREIRSNESVSSSSGRAPPDSEAADSRDSRLAEKSHSAKSIFNDEDEMERLCESRGVLSMDEMLPQETRDGSEDDPPIAAEITPLDTEVPPIDVPIDAEETLIDADVPRFDFPIDAEDPLIEVSIDEELTPLSTEVHPIDEEVTPIDAEVPPVDEEVTPIDSEVSPIEVEDPLRRRCETESRPEESTGASCDRSRRKTKSEGRTEEDSMDAFNGVICGYWSENCPKWMEGGEFRITDQAEYVPDVDEMKEHCRALLRIVESGLLFFAKSMARFEDCEEKEEVNDPETASADELEGVVPNSVVVDSERKDSASSVSHVVVRLDDPSEELVERYPSADESGNRRESKPEALVEERSVQSDFPSADIDSVGSDDARDAACSRQKDVAEFATTDRPEDASGTERNVAAETDNGGGEADVNPEECGERLANISREESEAPDEESEGRPGLHHQVTPIDAEVTRIDTEISPINAPIDTKVTLIDAEASPIDAKVPPINATTDAEVSQINAPVDTEATAINTEITPINTLIDAEVIPINTLIDTEVIPINTPINAEVIPINAEITPINAEVTPAINAKINLINAEVTPIETKVPPIDPEITPIPTRTTVGERPSSPGNHQKASVRTTDPEKGGASERAEFRLRIESLLKLRDYDSILREGREAVARDPRDFEAHACMGLANALLDRPERALSCYRKAERLNPRAPYGECLRTAQKLVGMRKLVRKLEGYSEIGRRELEGRSTPPEGEMGNRPVLEASGKRDMNRKECRESEGK